MGESNWDEKCRELMRGRPSHSAEPRVADSAQAAA